MWTDDLQSQIFSRIAYDSEMQKLQKKYLDFTLTTSTVSSTEPTFPTLVLQQLETPEVTTKRIGQESRKSWGTSRGL